LIIDATSHPRKHWEHLIRTLDSKSVPNLIGIKFDGPRAGLERRTYERRVHRGHQERFVAICDLDHDRGG
jgi:hypothetical protein